MRCTERISYRMLNVDVFNDHLRLSIEIYHFSRDRESMHIILISMPIEKSCYVRYPCNGRQQKHFDRIRFVS